MVLNALDFRIDNMIELKSLGEATANMIETQVREDELLVKLRNRSQFQWRKIYAIRVTLALVNAAFLGGCAWIII